MSDNKVRAVLAVGTVIVAAFLWFTEPARSERYIVRDKAGYRVGTVEKSPYSGRYIIRDRQGYRRGTVEHRDTAREALDTREEERRGRAANR